MLIGYKIIDLGLNSGTGLQKFRNLWILNSFSGRVLLRTNFKIPMKLHPYFNDYFSKTSQRISEWLGLKWPTKIGLTTVFRKIALTFWAIL
jgi:hypothetical protein